MVNDNNDGWAVMRAVFRHLLTCAVLACQVAGDTIRVDAGADSSTYSLAGATPRELGASIRLTQYDLPASTVYYLPAGSPRVKKKVNQTRPLANGYFSTFYRVVIAQLCIQAELFSVRDGAMHSLCDVHQSSVFAGILQAGSSCSTQQRFRSPKSAGRSASCCKGD